MAKNCESVFWAWKASIAARRPAVRYGLTTDTRRLIEA